MTLATAAQNAGLWSGWAKWQNSCTTTYSCAASGITQSRRAKASVPVRRLHDPSGWSCPARRFWAYVRPGSWPQTADSIPGKAPAYGPAHPPLQVARGARPPRARAGRRPGLCTAHPIGPCGHKGIHIAYRHPHRRTGRHGTIGPHAQVDIAHPPPRQCVGNAPAVRCCTFVPPNCRPLL